MPCSPTCGLKVQLSDPSTFKNYEGGIHDVMSDNICFPAKLVHGHINNLIRKRVNRIFMPYVIYERQDDKRTAEQLQLSGGLRVF